MKQVILWCMWLVIRAYAAFRPKITARGPDGTPIFHRWFLTSRPVGDSTGTPGWYLHHLTSADYDPHEHNHPWKWAKTRVLRGSYFETRDGATYWRKAGAVAHFTGRTFHRIAGVRHSTWTLFHAGPKHGNGWQFADGRKARNVNGQHAPANPPRTCALCETEIPHDNAVAACGECIAERGAS